MSYVIAQRHKKLRTIKGKIKETESVVKSMLWEKEAKSHRKRTHVWREHVDDRNLSLCVYVYVCGL